MYSIKHQNRTLKQCTNSVSHLFFYSDKNSTEEHTACSGKGIISFGYMAALSSNRGGRCCRKCGLGDGQRETTVVPGLAKSQSPDNVVTEGAGPRQLTGSASAAFIFLSLWWELIPGEPTNTTENIWLDILSVGARANRFLAAAVLCR